MTSSTDAPLANMVPAILAVSVARILALTPLPSPSDRTAMNEEGVVTIST